MAQLNVAREPSMDEILASIRKIIESNEPGPTGSLARQTFEDHADDEIELPIDSEIEAAAFSLPEEQLSSIRPSLAATGDTHSDTPVPSSAPLSLADVAARVRAASERHAVSHVARGQPDDEQARSLQDRPESISRMEAVTSSATAPDSATENSASGVLAHMTQAPMAAEPPLAQRSIGADEAREAGGAAGAIVSPDVSRQVARAFDDLAHAVENGPRRSFDEIAETMLRPMLQEWLDDNLPTLVERLVREEIERVARGPRR